MIASLSSLKSLDADYPQRWKLQNIPKHIKTITFASPLLPENHCKSDFKDLNFLHHFVSKKDPLPASFIDKNYIWDGFCQDEEKECLLPEELLPKIYPIAKDDDEAFYFFLCHYLFIYSLLHPSLPKEYKDDADYINIIKTAKKKHFKEYVPIGQYYFLSSQKKRRMMNDASCVREEMKLAMHDILNELEKLVL